MTSFKNHYQITKNLRIAALVGIVATALFKIFSISEIIPNQYYGFYALALIIFGVFVSLVVFGRTTLAVLKNPDFLVPVGLYLTADTLSGLVAQSTSFVGFRNGKLDLTGLTFIFVCTALLKLAISVCFTGWMTRIILRFVETEKVDLVASFRGFKWWFPRTLAFIVFGWLPLYLLFGVIFLPAWAGGNGLALTGSIFTFMFVVAACALVWNLATALVLPFILSVQTTLTQAFVEGMKFSWAHKKKTLLPVLLLMICAGWIILISVTYTERKDGIAEFGEVSESFSSSTTNKFNYSTHFVWIGDYPEKSIWHTEVVKAVDAEPLAPIGLRVALLMLFLSLVVNLKIIREAFAPQNDEFSTEGAALKKIYFNRAAAGILIILFLPLEIITQNLHPRHLFSSNSTKIPETVQVIKGETFFNKQKIFETGQGNTVSLAQKEDRDKFEMRGINDVAVGNLDGETGQEIMVATGKGTLLLNTDGAIKKIIPYRMESSAEDNLNSYFSHQRIVDIGGDGIYEVVNYDNYHAANGIYDLEGKSVLEFEKKASENTNAVLATGDLDGNRIAELYVISDDEIKPFQLGKSQKLDAVFDEKKVVFDEGGNFRLLTNQGQAVVKDAAGKILKKASKPFLQYGYLTGQNKAPLSIYFGENSFGLFDLDGKLKAKYAAPLSTEKYGYFDKKDELYGSDLKVSIFQAEAFEVRLQKDKSPFIAVMAYQSREMANFTSMLYVYNSEGALVYHELLDAIGTRLLVAPAENDAGTESLIVLENDRIWKYTTQ